MFVAGAGDAEIDIPDGAARYVDAGSQLLLQMHLVNSSSKTVTDFAEVKMDRSLEQSPGSGRALRLRHHQPRFAPEAAEQRRGQVPGR